MVDATNGDEPAEPMPASPRLHRYLPRIALEWDLDAPASLVREVDATLVFVDISGFTRLSERLARRGRIGAEELTEVLSTVFASMLQLAYERGGGLLKFGGDALLLLFDRGDHASQACAAAVEMRSALRDASKIATSVGRLDLRMSVGVHTGLVQLFLVGGSHQELILAGPAASATALMEQTAEQGEIVVSPATVAALAPGSVGVAKGAGWLLRWRRPGVAPCGPVLVRRIGPGVAERRLPSTLRSHLAAGVVEAEHRIASVAFLRFEGTDELLADRGPEAVAEALDASVRIVQAAADREGVTFLASDLDRGGFKVILVAGVPGSHDDDEGRLLRAVRGVLDGGAPLPGRVGVNRGHVFAGDVGTEHRSTFTVMGDTVNLAARLMAAAPLGSIYATAGVLDRSRTVFEATPLEPFLVKGKAAPVQAYDVGPETGTRPSGGGAALPLAGRAAERAALLALLDAAVAGRGAAASIVGEAGIGKSRLTDEVRAAAAGLVRVEVRGEPYGVAAPYRALRDPVRSLLGIERAEPEVMARQLRASVSRVAPELLALLPLLGSVAAVEVPETEETAALEPRFRRERLQIAVVTLLEAALDGPTLIVVEDAQWIDEATAELLDRLVAVVARHPWLVCVTRREGPGGFLVPTGATVTLGPLPDDEASALVVAATEAAPLRPHEVEAVVQRAAGSPLYLEELVLVAREAGGLDQLPDSLDAVVGAEIDALAPLTRRLLRYAAVLGRSFRPAVLAEVLAGEDLVLDEGARGQLARYLLPDGQDRLRFRHGVLRDAAYGGLPYRRRRELHERAGVAIERLAQPNPEGVADALALHFALAQDHERTWRYARVAGGRAAEAFANVEAAAHYERALEAGRRVPGVGADDLLAVSSALGDVREQAGLFEGALDAFRRAQPLAGNDPVARAHLLYRAARVRERTGAYPVALGLLTRARRLIADRHDPAADAARARLLAAMAMIRQAQGRPAEALATALQAVDDAREAREGSALAKAYLVVDWANVQLGRSDADELGPAALALFEAEGDLPGQAAVLNNLGCLAFFAGRWTEAVELYERSRSASLRYGNAVQAGVDASNIAEVLVAQGRLDEAEPLLQEALRVNRASGFLDGAAFTGMLFGRLLERRGDVAAAERELTAARLAFESLGATTQAVEASLYLAECLARSGRPSDALDVLGGAERSGREALVLAATLARVRAVALVALGRLDEAAAAVEAGLVEARRQDLPYDVALLLAVAVDVDRRRGREPDQGQVREADRLLAELGVLSVAALAGPGWGAQAGSECPPLTWDGRSWGRRRRRAAR